MLCCTAFKRHSKLDRDDCGSASESAISPGRLTQNDDHITFTAGSSHSGTTTPSVKTKKMSFKVAGQTTLSLLNARRRIEDGLRSLGRRRSSKREPSDDG